MKTIYEEIQQRRIDQDEKHGGPAHDDTHSAHDWIAFVVKQCGKTVIGPLTPWELSNFRQQMTHVAALAVAAIEWCDRIIERRAKER